MRIEIVFVRVQVIGDQRVNFYSRDFGYYGDHSLRTRNTFSQQQRIEERILRSDTSVMAAEIDRIDQQIDQTTDQTLAATRRILQTAEETNQIGVDTLVTLNEQGEKLDHVEQRLDEINVDLKRTDRNLSEIEKCCGCIACPCGPGSYQV